MLNSDVAESLNLCNQCIEKAELRTQRIYFLVLLPSNTLCWILSPPWKLSQPDTFKTHFQVLKNSESKSERSLHTQLKCLPLLGSGSRVWNSGECLVSAYSIPLCSFFIPHTALWLSKWCFWVLQGIQRD